MGVTGLFNIIRKYAPNVPKKSTLAALKGKTVAVDITIYIYKWTHAGITNGIKNPSGEYINHLQGIFFMAASAIIAGINLIFVFEGRPPAAKAATLAARKTARENGAIVVPHDTFSECKQVLSFMGIPYIDAWGEAEATCAWLVQRGIADIIASEDSDCLVYAGSVLARGFTNNISIIDREELLKEMNMTSESFIDLAILLGTDYNKPILGPVTAYKTIKKYHSIENSKVDVDDLNDLRSLFTTSLMPPTIHFGSMSMDCLEHYLLCDNLLSESRLSKTLGKLRKLGTKTYCIYGFIECTYFHRAVAVANKRVLDGKLHGYAVSVYPYTRLDWYPVLAKLTKSMGVDHETSPLVVLVDTNEPTNTKYIGGYTQWNNMDANI